MTDAIPVPESLEAARALDAADPLSALRDRFHFPDGPQGADGPDPVYFCGNSLGLQPRAVREHILYELDQWARLGVEGHFDGPRPWYSYHEPLAAPMAAVVGAKPQEVVVMNSLTVNLHLLLISFYRPTSSRHRIVIEASAFPSDRYAVASQARLHGFDPDEAIVELHPREGEATLRTEDVEAYLEREGDKVALVMFGGVNYYTGQAFDMARITAASHRIGACVGFDLAHAAGNLALQLHDWDVDFAAWCSYKYLNAGPGGVGAAFVHERHAHNDSLPRLAGWWGNDPKTRFEMSADFVPKPGADGWQLSNAPILLMASLSASLSIFEEVGMSALRARSERLTGALLGLIDRLPGERIALITPRDAASRGCQLSLRTLFDGRALFAELQRQGVICDFREPDVIRVAPVPLYNTYEDLWRFTAILRGVLEEENA